MIVPVKKTNLVALRRDKDILLELLQKHSIMMIDTLDETKKIDTQYEDNLYLRCKKVLDFLQEFNKKATIFSYQEVDYNNFNSKIDERIKLLEHIESKIYQYSKLNELNEEKTKEKENFSAFNNLSISTLDAKNANYVDFKFGYILDKNKDSLENYFKENNILHEFFNQSEKGVAVSYCTLKEEESVTLNAINSIGFCDVILPTSEKPFKNYLEDITKEIDTNNKKRETLKKELEELTHKTKELKILADKLLSIKEKKLVQYHETEQTIILSGWIKEKEEEKLKRILDNSKLDYEVEFSNISDDIKKPTALENHKLIKPFETITNMYSVPSSKDIDPNPIMSFWFWLIFGIAMGDIGYGLILSLGFGLILKFKKPKGEAKNLLTIFCLSGITSIIAGILFDSFFGISIFQKMIGREFALTNVIEKPLDLMLFSIGLGILHLICGQIMHMIKAFKLKDPLGAISGGLSWLLFLIGITLAYWHPVLSMFYQNIVPVTKAIKAFKYIGISFILSGLLIVLFLSGYDKKGIGKKITAGLGGLYNITGYLSDLLSYTRILALTLSSAVIAYVMNLLAKMIGPKMGGFGWVFSIIIFIFGHLFNFALSLLSAYVHDSRLQYIEFYGKFYEGNGYQFEPFSYKLENINKVIIN